MELIQTSAKRSFFDFVGETDRSQAATMTIQPGEATGGEDNLHPESDQWLFVISGKGKAVIEGRDVALEPGHLLLIEAGERHEIENDGEKPLATVNVYTPPAF